MKYKMFKKAAILFIFVLLILGISACTQKDGEKNIMKASLEFDENGSFSILIFSDLRLSPSLDENIVSNMKKMLDSKKPSLVLIGGDLHDGSVRTEQDLRKILDVIEEMMASRHIYWCHTFGVNTEGLEGQKTNYSKEEQMKVYQSYPHCLSKDSMEGVYGVGNYVLPVAIKDSDTIGFNVWCMDANGYLNDYIDDLEDSVVFKKAISGGTNLDCLHFSQILWYWDMSVAMEKQNSGTIPGLMYFQVPPYQFNAIHKNPNVTDMNGTIKENVSSSERESGIVWTCFERGDIKGIFCGYDAKNDFAGTYMNMLLANCSSLNSGYAETSGARLVTISENGKKMTSEMVYVKDL